MEKTKGRSFALHAIVLLGVVIAAALLIVMFNQSTAGTPTAPGPFTDAPSASIQDAEASS